MGLICRYRNLFQNLIENLFEAQVSCHIWDPLTPHFCWFLANFCLVTTHELCVFVLLHTAEHFVDLVWFWEALGTAHSPSTPSRIS